MGPAHLLGLKVTPSPCLAQGDVTVRGMAFVNLIKMVINFFCLPVS